MEEKKEKSILNNVTRNPITTGMGLIVFGLVVFAWFVEYILPTFVKLNEPLVLHWYWYALGLFVSLALIFMNDYYFHRIFNRGDKYAAKFTGTQEVDKKEEETV